MTGRAARRRRVRSSKCRAARAAASSGGRRSASASRSADERSRSCERAGARRVTDRRPASSVSAPAQDRSQQPSATADPSATRPAVLTAHSSIRRAPSRGHGDRRSACSRGSSTAPVTGRRREPRSSGRTLDVAVDEPRRACVGVPAISRGSVREDVARRRAVTSRSRGRPHDVCLPAVRAHARVGRRRLADSTRPSPLHVRAPSPAAPRMQSSSSTHRVRPARVAGRLPRTAVAGPHGSASERSRSRVVRRSPHRALADDRRRRRALVPASAALDGTAGDVADGSTARWRRWHRSRVVA